MELYKSLARLERWKKCSACRQQKTKPVMASQMCASDFYFSALSFFLSRSAWINRSEQASLSESCAAIPVTQAISQLNVWGHHILLNLNKTSSDGKPASLPNLCGCFRHHCLLLLASSALSPLLPLLDTI